MKYRTKSELIADAESEWTKLWAQIEELNSKGLERRIGSGQCARSVTDHLAHLYAWHRLMLGWIKLGPSGKPDLPAKGFKWNQTPALNQELFEAFQDSSFLGIRRKLKRSHGSVMKFTSGLSNSQVIKPGYYAWTGKLGLASYIGPNTAGHYRWAQKKIKASR